MRNLAHIWQRFLLLLAALLLSILVVRRSRAGATVKPSHSNDYFDEIRRNHNALRWEQEHRNHAQQR